MEYVSGAEVWRGVEALELCMCMSCVPRPRHGVVVQGPTPGSRFGTLPFCQIERAELTGVPFEGYCLLYRVQYPRASWGSGERCAARLQSVANLKCVQAQ